MNEWMAYERTYFLNVTGRHVNYKWVYSRNVHVNGKIFTLPDNYHETVLDNWLTMNINLLEYYKSKYKSNECIKRLKLAKHKMTNSCYTANLAWHDSVSYISLLLLLLKINCICEPHAFVSMKVCSPTRKCLCLNATELFLL